MHNFEELIDFINKNEDFEELFKHAPFYLKTTHCPFNPNWYMFTYDLINSNFNEPIVNESRGTAVEIIDHKVTRVIKAPFIKFFNIEESHASKIDWPSSKVLEKIDGQLITLCKIDNNAYFFTNGSFTLGTKFLNNKEYDTYAKVLFKALQNEDKDKIEYIEKDYETKDAFIYDTEWTRNIPEGYTLLFELVSPLTPIKITYDEIKIYFIGIRNNLGDEEFVIDAKEKYHIPYEVPKYYDLHNLEDVRHVLKTMGVDKEGFVVVDKYFNRVKIKTESYLLLNYYMDELSPGAILHCILEGTIDDLYAKKAGQKEILDNEVEKFKTYRKNFEEVYEFAKKKYQELNQDKKALSEYFKNSNKTIFSISMRAPSFSFEDIYKHYLEDYKRRGYTYYEYVYNSLLERDY